MVFRSLNFTITKFAALISVFLSITQCQNRSCDCGVANDLNSGRILGGTKVDITFHPWLVMVVRNHDLLCAGALLNSRFFITVAHCFNSRTKLSEIKVLLGVSKYPPQFDKNRHIVTSVDKVIVHPEYNSLKLKNDICAVRLSTSVVFSFRIRPVCLPTFDFNLDGQNVVLAGWGETSENGQPSESLQEITLPIVSLQECYDVLRHPFLSDSNLCAGFLSGSRDACQGDSGSPLIWLSNNTWFAVGLVSWGEGCGRVGVYGVYTRISKYTDWINKVVTNEDQCSFSHDKNQTLHLNDTLQEEKNKTDESAETVEAEEQLQIVVNKGCNSVNRCQMTSRRRARIMGGNEVSPDNYPWMTAVVEICGKDCVKLLCAGIAIGCRWLLSAAACILKRDTSVLRVTYGVYDISKLKTDSFQLTGIEKVIVTPNQIRHNLVLIKTAPVFNNTICLPPLRLETESFVDGKLIAVGWGRSSTTGKISSVLREVTLPIVPNKKCSKYFPRIIHKGILCAGGAVNESICFGDFGGPLIWQHPRSGAEYVVGISSFFSPKGCGFDQIPAGFVRLTSYVSWIIGAVQRET